jgi:gliding motility-associated-like protein
LEALCTGLCRYGKEKYPMKRLIVRRFLLILPPLLLIALAWSGVAHAPLFSAFSASTLSAPAPCDRPGDSLALVALYQSTDGANWNTPWDLNLPMETWAGVALNPEGCVDQLDLELDALNGTLPVELGNLTNITRINLSNNPNLTGNIPNSITNLITLTHLNLGGCNLNGPIPANIGNLNLLEELNLRSNQLTGTIPASIGNLAELLDLDLGNNLLNGSIPPEIGDLGNLFFLYLDNNNLSGSIPSELGNCTNLIRLWLDDNSLTGSVPESFGNLTLLQVLWLSKNELEGAIPDTFQNLSSLNHLEIQFNHFNYLPDLSGLMALMNQVNKLRLQENNLSFDDILPNLGPGGQAIGDFYFPQDSVGEILTLEGCIDQEFCIDLGIDSGIVSNQYEWSKDGGPYGAFSSITGFNQLCFGNLTPADAGVYRCRITNPNAPLLELYSRPVSLNVSCCDIEITIAPTLCPGETVVVNGTTYGEAPSFPENGTEIIANATSCGADSLIHVNLSFFTPSVFNLDTLICPEGSLTVNGELYDADNPTGQEILPGADQNGCDSIINVSLGFLPPVTDTLAPVLCPGSSIVVNGTTYDEDMPEGSESFPGGAANGCDSLLVVQLSFTDSIITNLSPTLCTTDTIGVNGVDYYFGNATGTEIMLSSNGCDSIIFVDLQFLPLSQDTFPVNICAGETYFFNDSLYALSGFLRDTLTDSNGCDSFLFVNLVVLDTSLTLLQDSICAGDSLFFNETYFTETGTFRDTLTNLSGCDSFLVLELFVKDTFFTSLDTTICQGQAIDFLGNTLSQEGAYQQVLTAANGCDSTIQLNLNVLDTFQTVENLTICQGEEILFGGMLLSESGLYRDTLPAQNGCDSFLVLDLTVLDTFQTLINQSICEGQAYFFNGQNLVQSGIYRDTLNAQNGCDSFLLLDLIVNETFSTQLDISICENEFFVFAGDTLTAPGSYRDTMSLSTGCDSVVILELEVLDTFITQLSGSVCAGECVDFGGLPRCASGVYVQNLIAENGCDSTVFLDLLVRDTFRTQLSTSICAGEAYDFLGMMISEEGVYQQTLTASNGCDSTLLLDLTVLDTFRTSISQSICANETYDFLGTILTESGLYLDTLSTVEGCDSIIELELMVLDTFQTFLQASICKGEVYDFLGTPLSESGIYLDTLSALNGCDSIIQLALTALDTFQTVIDASICQGEIYDFLGTGLFQSGSYRDTLPTQFGCDSIFILNLNVLDTFQTVIDASICQGEVYDFLGTPLIDSGTYRDTLPAQNGCDSMFVLHLNVLDTFRSLLETTICQGEIYDFLGTPISQSGTYLDTLPAQNGCDSILQLELTVLDTFRTDIMEALCAGDSLFFNQEWIFLPGAYRDTLPAKNGCDSILVLELEVLDTAMRILELELCEGESINLNGNIYNQSGEYREVIQGGAQNGCDSIVMLDLTVVDGATFGFADAGPDFSACLDTVALNANLPGGVTGQWLPFISNGAAFSDPNAASTLLYDLSFGEQTVIWSLSTDNCPNYDSDTVTIFREAAPRAFDDLILIPEGEQSWTFSVLENDILQNVPLWDVSIVEEPNFGQLETSLEGELSYTFQGNIPGTIRFKYELCNGNCPNLCDTARVAIETAPIPEPKDSIFIPNTITPNGDGLNDFFEIGNLDNLLTKYPNNEMIIFSRWGNRLFRQSPYTTPWDGRDQNSGKELPEGTYYYIFRLDTREGKVYRGDITVLR